MAIKKKEKIVNPVKSLKGVEREYRKQLNLLGKFMIEEIKNELLPFLKSQEPAYVLDGSQDAIKALFKRIDKRFKSINDYEYNYNEPKDSKSVYLFDWLDSVSEMLTDSRQRLSQIKDNIGTEINNIFNRLNFKFKGNIVAGFSRTSAESMVNQTIKKNKKRFDRALRGATGIDMSQVVASEGLEDFISLSVSKNVSLIESLPAEYLKQVEVIVNNGVVSGARYSTIAKEIQKGANKELAGRIKTIAMNEVQTINAQINVRRSEALGITEGIYRTSEDERVRPCHKQLNGKRFKLDQGAWSSKCQKYIIPGVTDINCRCTYSPIIEVEGV